MKRYFFGALALAAGFVSSASTIPGSNFVDPVWFHFYGNATVSADLNNPAKYGPTPAPICASTIQPFRCDILIQASTSNPNQPDLSKPIQQERKRSTPQ